MRIEESYAFQKTDQGAEELNARSSTLSPKHRRCLILADGRKTVRDLARCFRPGELAPILRELVEGGYLEPPPGGVDAIEARAANVALIDEARFLDILVRAVHEITIRLGPRGDALANELGACRTPEELRVALRNAERVLQGFLGPEYARNFVKRFGQELMGGGSA